MKAILTSKEDGQTVTTQLGRYLFEVYKDIDCSPDDILLQDDKRWDVEVVSESETDQKLVLLSGRHDSLEDLNSLAYAIKNTHEKVRPEIERMLLNGDFRYPNELRNAMLEAVEDASHVVETFTFPLIGSLVENEDRSFMDMSYEYDDYVCPVDGYSMLYAADDIQDALAREQYPYDSDMAEYVDPDGIDVSKLISIRWSVDDSGDELRGKVSVFLTEPLDEDERAYLKGYILGQNSDGLGEGFEQRPVDTDYGELSVSMWHSGDDYEISEGEIQYNTAEQSYS